MAKDDKGLTPMMKQFFSLKAKHPEALMLFRCGDFYETYCEDAVTASRILGITLTRRNNGGQSGSMEMAGFPHHALDTYLPKLIRAGKRVAICDQLEDPKKKREQLKGKKGLTEMDKMVKRGITELVTPGVAMGDNVLNYRENNFLAAVHFGKTSCGVSFLDISTGEFLTGEGNYDYVEKLLGNFQPKEVLYDRARKTDFETRFGNRYCVFELDDWVFTEQTARRRRYGAAATACRIAARSVPVPVPQSRCAGAGCCPPAQPVPLPDRCAVAHGLRRRTPARRSAIFCRTAFQGPKHSCLSGEFPAPRRTFRAGWPPRAPRRGSPLAQSVRAVVPSPLFVLSGHTAAAHRCAHKKAHCHYRYTDRHSLH